jgi:hypothetical protein
MTAYIYLELIAGINTHTYMKSSSALFVPVCESLLLALTCGFLIHAFFQSTVPADYPAAMRAAVMITIILNIATAILHILIAAAYRTSEIVESAQGSKVGHAPLI